MKHVYNNMMKNNDLVKPRMVYFQADPSGYAPVNFEATVLRPLKCFSEFFDVTVINQDCDYNEVCQTYEPDIALFDCGDEAPDSRLNIVNTNTNTSVPKIGLMKGDVWSSSRVQCLYQIEQYGIEALFEQGDLALKEYLPEISDMIFYFPYFIDTDLYQDFSLTKVIPLLYIGDFDRPAYPWRNRIKNRIGSIFPTLTFHHPGYSTGFSSSFPIYGEQYARTINAACIVPSGGAFNKQFLKKHLEIPACRACLLSDDTPAVRAFGFKHFDNCVFVDENNVVDSIEHLFRNRDELERITENGYHFVRTHHSYRNRKQIIQWYNLRKGLKPQQTIVQTSLFGDLEIASDDVDYQSIIFSCEGIDKELLKQADICFFSGNIKTSIELYRRVGEFTSCIPEADLRLALCYLLTGEAHIALTLMEKLNRHALAQNSPTPDPVEWAYLIIALLCCGYLKTAKYLARQNGLLSDHFESERARWLVDLLDGQDILGSMNTRLVKDDVGKNRSIHRSPFPSFNAYTEALSTMLHSCGKQRWSKQVRAGNVSVNELISYNGTSDKISDFESTGFDFSAALKKVRGLSTRPIHRLALKKYALLNTQENSLSNHLQLVAIKLQWPFAWLRSSDLRGVIFFLNMLRTLYKVLLKRGEFR